MSIKSDEALPVDVANELRDIQINRSALLPHAVAALREKKWSLRRIGLVLGLSHESVRRLGIEGDASKSPLEAPPAPQPPKKEPGERVLRRQRSIPAATAKRLRKLQADASAMNGTAAPNSKQAKASAEYTALLGELWEADEKLPQKAFEEATGQKWGAIRRRLIRGGFIQEPPSMKKAYPRKTAEEKRREQAEKEAEQAPQAVAS